MFGLHFFKRPIGLCFPKTEVSKRPRNRTDRFGLTEHPPLTMLDVPPCRHREPQRTGARVSVEPSTPSSNLFGRLDPEHRLA
jgi:hypothetical protein